MGGCTCWKIGHVCVDNRVHDKPGPEIRALFGLPARLGGLGIRDPSEKALEQRDTSRAVTRPVVDLLLEQNEGDPLAQDRLEEALAEQSGLISRAKRQRAEEEKERQREVVGQLSPSLQSAVERATDDGAWSWLSARPIEEHGFALHKGAFRDAVALRYGWEPANLPSHCACGVSFDSCHALTSLRISQIWVRARDRAPIPSAEVFACYFEGLRSGWELIIHLAQCGLDNQSAGVARQLFFLLRHLSKFPSFKNENPSCRFWDMALGLVAVAFEKRSLPPYTRVRWRGMVRCGAFATKARKSIIVETSFAGALLRECTDRVLRTSLCARRCCKVVAWRYLDLGISRTVDRACSKGGLTIARHNEIWDLTASLISEVCSDVEIEPRLQPLSGEQFLHASANRNAEARLDIKARGFWGGAFKCAFFDVRVFNPRARTNAAAPSTAAMYRRHEQMKRRAYGQRVRDIEMSSFTPLVFSGAPQLEALALPLWLLSSASRCAWHLPGPCPTRQSWAGWDVGVSFALLRSAIMCLRGSRQHVRGRLGCPMLAWQSPKANFNPTSSNCASSNNKTLSLLLLSRLYSFLLTIFQEAMFILKF